MNSTLKLIHGILKKGHCVASGPSQAYPYGALERQIPLFKARGLDLTGYFNGTLNIDIWPYAFDLIKPQYTFYSVEWTDLHPPEHFSFSRCKVVYWEIEYDGWIYYPHPETKQIHHQDPSVLEVIAKPIPAINYGHELDVYINEEEVELIRQ